MSHRIMLNISLPCVKVSMKFTICNYVYGIFPIQTNALTIDLGIPINFSVDE